jgi:hypothetical protein
LYNPEVDAMPMLSHEAITTITHSTKIDRLAERIKNSQCILFLGAGVNFPSLQEAAYPYPESESPPLGGAFSVQLAKLCQFAEAFPKGDSGNLQRVSLCYEITNDREALVEEIKKAVHVDKQPSPVLHALADMPFSLIITTNYDQLFERALRDAGKNPIVGIYNKDAYAATVDHPDASVAEPFVFKLHGDIQCADSIVVTDEDYIQFVLRMTDKDAFHPVPETFRYNFKRWPTLFVGYSLLDYNLRLLFKTLRWKMDKANFPATYSVDPYPDPLIFDVWSNQNKYVTFIAQDVWTFVPELYRMVMGKEWTKDPHLYKVITGQELPI